MVVHENKNTYVLALVFSRGGGVVVTAQTRNYHFGNIFLLLNCAQLFYVGGMCVPLITMTSLTRVHVHTRTISMCASIESTEHWFGGKSFIT